MSHVRIDVIDSDGKPDQHSVDRLPDYCPLCLSRVSLQRPFGAIHRRPDTIEATFHCPNHRCRRLFIGYYSDIEGSPGYRLGDLQPSKPNPAQFGEAIEQVSPDFVTIYNQAKEAERNKLDEIAGPGYRKALEYLIRDYIIDKNPTKAEAIRKTALANCIKHHIDDTRIQSCAERAVWIGNDETHYYRQFHDHDIKDLKILISLTVNWIKSNILTEEYGDSMNKPDN